MKMMVKSKSEFQGTSVKRETNGETNSQLFPSGEYWFQAMGFNLSRSIGKKRLLL